MQAYAAFVTLISSVQAPAALEAFLGQKHLDMPLQFLLIGWRQVAAA